MPYTYDQPYSLDGTAGTSVQVFDSTNLTTPLTTFTADSNGRGKVALTVSDTSATTLYFVRASDSVRLAVVTVDPREIASLQVISAATIAGTVWASGTRTLTGFGTLTTDTATAVWGSTTRTLSSYGTLAADVWANGTRTLSAFAFTVNTNANTVETAIKAKTDNLPTDPASNTQVNTRLASTDYVAPDNAGIATLLSRLTAARAGFLDTLNGLVANIRADIERGGGPLSGIFADYARRTGDYATSANVSAVGTQVGNLNNVSTTQVQSAVQSGLTAQGYTPTRAGYLDTLSGIVNAVKVAIEGGLLAAVKLKTDLLGTSAVASQSDVQPTINFTPTINPTPVSGGYLASDRTRDEGIAAAAAELAPLIENGAFTVAALVNAPAGGGGTGGLTPTQDARLTQTATDVAVIRARQNDQVPEPAPVFSVAQAVDPAKAVVLVRTADFVGRPLKKALITLTLIDEGLLVIGGTIRHNRQVIGRTDENGELELETWHTDTIEDAGLSPDYELSIPGVDAFTIRVPSAGGLASDLKYPA
ncbi:hypothetical protein EON83_20300 [bacterium]|nr:MAG: hypothetical protein EON83_20300 [bacterium]